MTSKIISKIGHWFYFRIWDVLIWEIKHIKNLETFISLMDNKLMKKSMNVLFKQGDFFGGEFRKKSTQLSKIIFEKGFELAGLVMDRWKD